MDAAQPVHLAVDAFNLAADRRGMGRLVRQTLRELHAFNEVRVRLVARPQHIDALRREFDVAVVTPGALRTGEIDAVWYPWNAMRFAPHAAAIVTIHDPFAFMFAHRNLIARLREQLPIRRAIRQADRIFAVSHWTAGELERRFGIDPMRMRIVPNAPDRFWYPVPGARLRPYMFVLSSPEPRKNIGMLLRAYAQAFDEQGPELVIAGDLSAADAILLRNVRAPHSRIHAEDEELRRLYSGAIAVLVPSLAEGFGLPAVEAMACQAAVVASNTTALPETCGDAALLVDPGVALWSRALREIAQSQDLRCRLRAAAKAHAASMDPAGPAK
ncbi:MAG TPA: glycosyltransferase family 1 protein, partial [Candidatus Baltobacteraceae bacterium]|nr:glycosyltransferase family 1 protein [Candidatus Baltobacteraceae bacterium]